MINIKEERIPSQKDAQEFIMTTEYNSNHYVAFVEITGIRLAIESKPLGYFINKAKKSFSDMIGKKEISPKDRAKFCFWSKGDFIRFEHRSKAVNLNLKTSRYSSGRLHIEIPKEYKDLFEEGEEVTVIKD